jgi:hypothetical protein
LGLVFTILKDWTTGNEAVKILITSKGNLEFTEELLLYQKVMNHDPYNTDPFTHVGYISTV